MRAQSMSTILFMVAGAAVFFGAYALAVSTDSKSAIHEIEALLGFLIAAVGFGGGAIVTMLGRVQQSIDRGTQAAINEAKLAELRRAQ